MDSSSGMWMYPGTVNCEKYKIPQFCFQICLHFDPLSLLLNIARRNELWNCDKYPCLWVGRTDRHFVFFTVQITPPFSFPIPPLWGVAESHLLPTLPVPVIALADPHPGL